MPREQFTTKRKQMTQQYPRPVKAPSYAIQSPTIERIQNGMSQFIMII